MHFVRFSKAVLKPGNVGTYMHSVMKRNSNKLTLKVITGRIGEVYHFNQCSSFEDAVQAFNQVEENVERLEHSVFIPLDVVGAQGLANSPADGVYELRRYELQLGYSTVPRFRDLYAAGLVDKLQTDQTGESQLISLMYSEAGAAPLNTVIELWHHSSIDGSQRSRAASRAASKWRQAIADIASLAHRFETQLRPFPFRYSIIKFPMMRLV